MSIRVTSITDPGQLKSENQDAVYAKQWIGLTETYNVIAVADGMGGHGYGDVASRIAVDLLDRWCSCAFQQSERWTCESLSTAMDEMFRSVHLAIAQQNRSDCEQSGTTFSVCVSICEEYIVKSVGDSRSYLISEEDISQMTEDDSWVADQVKCGKLSPAEAKTHPKQNLLTRCIGLGEFSLPHTAMGNFQLGQIICICSDGYYKHLEECEFLNMIHAWRDNNENPFNAGLPILFERGETDNISVALMAFQ